MGWMLDTVGRAIARYLDQPEAGYEPFTPADPTALAATIQTGDVLLVEGNSHVSGVIKYLTQSTWSHAALYVGSMVPKDRGEPHSLIEANLGEGVVAVPLSNTSSFTPGSAGRSACPVNIANAFADMPSSVLASNMTSRISSTSCATWFPCRHRNAGADE